jgi:hypothetical protein
MSDQPISIAEFRAQRAKGSRARKPLYFQRDELSSIMQIYSRYVAAGHWRDYAIDFAPGVAVFSIFKSTHEQPTFTVAKRLGPSGKGREFVVHEGVKPIKRSENLADVLRALDIKVKN